MCEVTHITSVLYNKRECGMRGLIFKSTNSAQTLQVTLDIASVHADAFNVLFLKCLAHFTWRVIFWAFILIWKKKVTSVSLSQKSLSSKIYIRFIFIALYNIIPTYCYNGFIIVGFSLGGFAVVFSLEWQDSKQISLSHFSNLLKLVFLPLMMMITPHITSVPPPPQRTQIWIHYTVPH